MFKVMKAEIKKMVSKPGVYVLAVLLAIVLILGIFIYNPTVVESDAISLEGDTYTAKYASFYGNKTSSGKYIQVLNDIETSVATITNYTKNEKTQEEYINDLYNEFESALEDYQDAITYNTSNSAKNTAKSSVISALESLNSAIISGISSANDSSYCMLTTSSNYDTYVDTYAKILKIFNSDTSNETSNHDLIISSYKSYESEFKTTLNNFIYPTLSASFIETYTVSSEEKNTKLYIVYARLNSILDEIDSLYDEISAITDSNDNSNYTYSSKMDDLANKYIQTGKTFISLVKYELISNAFSFTSTSTQLDLYYLKSYSEYDVNSYLVKYTYLFENNYTDANFSTPLTIGVTSNDEINSYDYAYFVLRLFSFIIIVYAIMNACNTIAGEIKEGSMRYLAIRPITRSSILFGKLLAIIVMSTILIIFSGIISVCVGGAVYGFETNNILTIFNGSTVMIIHPIVMIIIYLASLLLELIVYSSIALLVSCLLKSDLFAVTFVLVLYLLNTLLPMFVSGANSWLAYYPFSHISLYSLFGSSIYAPADNFFNTLLGAKVYAGTNLILTIVIIIGFIAITNICSSILFKKKEL